MPQKSRFAGNTYSLDRACPVRIGLDDDIETWLHRAHVSWSDGRRLHPEFYKESFII